ncbi:MAG TPA: ComEC/Rec2 family competence protein [Verrucomicrobiae bacterium]|nr:ComEC/Rec2 family competence protein [Verrucomicrobiae bacterium]
MRKYRIRRTWLWLIAFMALITGLGLARTGYRFSGLWCGVALGLLFASLCRRSLLTAILVVAFGISVGWWRGSQYLDKLAGYQGLYHRKLTITAQALTDGVYGAHSQISFNASKIRLPDGETLKGQVQISGFGLNSVLEGDEVQVSGKLYPGYGAYQARLSFARLQLIRHHPSLVAEIRRRFAAGMQSALPEPLASFAMGLLIGQRTTLPATVKQDLLMVGLTHIIAVSGYNLTIILRASRGLLAQHSKRLSLAFSVSLTGTFLLLSGLSASIVRAAIVSMLSIYASYYGRSFKPLNLILFAAAVTTLANPVYLWSDISWYLSFLAFFGVMIVSPLLAARFPHRLHNSIIFQVALESVCAEFMTVPIILYAFGQMSFIGLVANVLVVALIPLAMLLTAVAGLSGMLAGAIAGWVSWPARLLLTYMLDVAHALARLPHIFVQNVSISLLQMLFLYAVVLLLVAGLWFKSKTKSGMITDKI